MVKTRSEAQRANLAPAKMDELRKVAALREQPREGKDRIVISGQVADGLVPYVRSALGQGVSKTDLINLALAAYFEVEVYRAAAA